MIGPATTSPSPPPTAVIAAITPTPAATLVGGNSSRMIPKESGRTPRRRPGSRPMMRTPIECARPATTEPSASAPSVASRTRSLPTMSPTRPMIGVAMDADNR